MVMSQDWHPSSKRLAEPGFIGELGERRETGRESVRKRRRQGRGQQGVGAGEEERKEKNMYFRSERMQPLSLYSLASWADASLCSSPG